MDDETKTVEPNHYTLKEAGEILQRSSEAVRKLWERGRLKGHKREEDNRVVVWLDEETVSAIPPSRAQDDEEEEDLAAEGWHRLADTLENQATVASTELSFLRQTLDDERAARDKERAEWNRQMSIERAARDAERAHWTQSLAEASANMRELRDAHARERASLERERDAARASARRAQAALASRPGSATKPKANQNFFGKLLSVFG